jgi:hypothetical protein
MKYLVYLLVLANVAYFGWNMHLNQTAGEVARELPPLPGGVTPLVTLPELKKQKEQVEDISEVEALTSSQPPGAGAAPSCQAIGPFLAIEELQAVSAELRQHGLQVHQRTAKIQKPNGFWVYLPAMQSEQVLQAVKTLEENRDREYYVGKGNFLALGTFDEMSRAENRLEQIRKLGFDPILEARYQTATEYWLDIDAQTSAADELEAIMQDRHGLKLQNSACQ